LDYYTGAILEVTSPEVPMGSLGGGGRYDHLTEIFGLKNMTGVGISFGAERILDVLNQLNRYPNLSQNATKVLIIALDAQNFDYATQQLHYLRTKNINTELYPEPTKLKKQIQYANDKKIPYAIIIGENEQKTQLITLKNMDNGSQQSLPIAQIAEILKN
jgi:histidyl-tRNA synthetase